MNGERGRDDGVLQRQRAAGGWAGRGEASRRPRDTGADTQTHTRPVLARSRLLAAALPGGAPPRRPYPPRSPPRATRERDYRLERDETALPRENAAAAHPLLPKVCEVLVGDCVPAARGGGGRGCRGSDGRGGWMCVGGWLIAEKRSCRAHGCDFQAALRHTHQPLSLSPSLPHLARVQRQ